MEPITEDPTPVVDLWPIEDGVQPAPADLPWWREIGCWLGIASCETEARPKPKPKPGDPDTCPIVVESSRPTKEGK
jgi:hypothetical protein